ncbi:MAG: zinc-ribbon domain-containing protein [Clostridiales bacterium]|nr:zinc-ribbon domain-containing protein [Clostridiales bacterium]
MAFFEEVKSKIKQTSMSTVQKTQEFSEIVKLNSKINETKEKISELYSQIGYELYRQFEKEALPEIPDIADLLSQVSDLHKTINDYQSQINAIQDSRLCPNCGAKVTPGKSFCSECGAKLLSRDKTTENEKACFCSKCGAPLETGAIFCVSCGAKIE